MATTAFGTLRYKLFKPPGARRTDRLPLLLMLHGCEQDADALAASSKMNQLAAQKKFYVLYPQQERHANPHGCWNWFDTRSGRAQREADAIAGTLAQVCRLHGVDDARIALAGLSAGAGMAALVAVRHPGRFRALVMHSGISAGVATSALSAMAAMRGRRIAAKPLPATTPLPALMVIHGDRDRVVAPGNAVTAAEQWAAQMGARAMPARLVQRGMRYPVRITDYKVSARTAVTLRQVIGLGHAWSGGSRAWPHGDPQGPSATRLVWDFASKQFDH